MKKLSLALTLAIALAGASLSSAIEIVNLQANNCFATGGTKVGHNFSGVWNAGLMEGPSSKVNCPISLKNNSYNSLTLKSTGVGRSPSGANPLYCKITATDVNGFVVKADSSIFPFNPNALVTLTKAITFSQRPISFFVTCNLPANFGDGLSYISNVTVEARP